MQKFHFIAIGGVGMSALAKYLKQKGEIVTGSDISESKYTKLLQEMGIKISIGHDANLIDKDMIIIASSAIKDDNPEIVRAKELGLKIWHRSDVLKLISDEFSKRENSIFIGYAGTHGKTTTSGMCSYVLEKSGLAPAYVLGGILPEINTNGNYSDKKFFVAELDESDGTLEKYATDIAVINNMEEDHLDYYKNGFTDIAKTFNTFLSNKSSQIVVINSDNDGNKEFMKLYPNYKYITFGLKNALYRAKNIVFEGLGSSFDIYYNETKIDSIRLSVPGEHNVYNALAVYVSLKEAGVDITKYTQHFYSFTGMGRRFQQVAEFNGIKIYDDYAHHPSEIQTTLNSVKNAKRLVAIFQPHRYSRLQGLWNEFKKSFTNSDMLVVTDVYSAGEAPIEGINSEIFTNEINHKNKKYVSGSMQECAKKIYPLLQDGDIVLTLGAGTITKLGSEIKNLGL